MRWIALRNNEAKVFNESEELMLFCRNNPEWVPLSVTILQPHNVLRNLIYLFISETGRASLYEVKRRFTNHEGKHINASLESLIRSGFIGMEKVKTTKRDRTEFYVTESKVDSNRSENEASSETGNGSFDEWCENESGSPDL